MIVNEIQIWMGGYDNGRTPAVQQNDINSRIYICKLWQGRGRPYLLADGARVGVVFKWRRRLGSPEYEAQILDQSTVAVKVPKEAMRMDGIVKMQLILHEGDEVLHSPEISFGVMRSIEPDENDSEEPKLLLLELTSKANELINSIEEKLENGELKGEKGDKGDKGDPGSVTRESVREALGYTPANALLATSSGDQITGAIGGRAEKVKVELKPVLENGAFAPDPNGGRFAPWRETALTVNGNRIAAKIYGEPYLGMHDFTKGVTTARGVKLWKAEDLFILSTQTAPGTNSQGIKYIRLQLREELYDVDVPSQFVACNRYQRKDASPFLDKSIRLNTNNPYVYDNDIDLDNPMAIIDGLEFLLAEGDDKMYASESVEVMLNAGENVITSDAGSVTVEYAMDTKAYIDQKFAELSAASE